MAPAGSHSKARNNPESQVSDSTATSALRRHGGVVIVALLSAALGAALVRSGHSSDSSSTIGERPSVGGGSAWGLGWLGLGSVNAVDAAEARVAVMITAPSDVVARELATGLVEARLAACVNALPGVASTYQWQGETVTDTEVLLIAKTRRGALPALSAWVTARHPYAVPEVVAMPIVAGSAPYLQWLDEAVPLPPPPSAADARGAQAMDEGEGRADGGGKARADAVTGAGFGHGSGVDTTAGLNGGGDGDGDGDDSGHMAASREALDAEAAASVASPQDGDDEGSSGGWLW